VSVALRFDLSGIDGLAKRVAALADFDKDGLLDALGAEVESQTTRRLRDEKTAPDGTPWPELSEKYKRQKAEHGSSGGLLDLEGDLISSIDHQLIGSSVEIGSNMVYAAHHNFGGEDIGTGMPQRQFLGFSAENIHDLEGVTEDFLSDLVSNL
jgi:phage virion morphogenesis protein